MSRLASLATCLATFAVAIGARADDAADRQQSMYNLKHFGLAMHNYHDAQERFPAVANYDENGKPLLSWRVHVLPHLGYEDLHKKFRLDEPWDSEHNKKLIAEMPEVYACPSHDLAEGKTVYLAPRGKGLAFQGKKGKRLGDFGDGTSNTILVVEANPDKAVVWTRPEDLQVDLDKPLASLGEAHPKGFNATFGDGSVRFLPKEIDADLLKALFTRNSQDEVTPF